MQKIHLYCGSGSSNPLARRTELIRKVLYTIKYSIFATSTMQLFDRNPNSKYSVVCSNYLHQMHHRYAHQKQIGIQNHKPKRHLITPSCFYNGPIQSSKKFAVTQIVHLFWLVVQLSHYVQYKCRNMHQSQNRNATTMKHYAPNYKYAHQTWTNL